MVCSSHSPLHTLAPSTLRTATGMAISRAELLLLATHECGLPVGPLDGSAADLADGEFRVVIAERTSSQVVGDQEGVAVAATPTRDQPVHRVEVTT
jgi:hypothetical protein